MPLLKISCSHDEAERIVGILQHDRDVIDVAVVDRTDGGGLVLAEVTRSGVDRLLTRVRDDRIRQDVHVSIQHSDVLLAGGAARSDPDAVIWAEVSRDIEGAGTLSWANLSLVTVAGCIAAIGIIQDQLLLIIAAMSISPDYYPIAGACLSLARRDGRRFVGSIQRLGLILFAGTFGAWFLAEVLAALGVISPDTATTRQLTLFISDPDALAVVVAALAGVAGAISITLPDTRGLVGVFISITTIPAAANLGVAMVARDGSEMVGAALQLIVNVIALVAAGTIALILRGATRQLYLRVAGGRAPTQTPRRRSRRDRAARPGP